MMIDRQKRLVGVLKKRWPFEVPPTESVKRLTPQQLRKGRL